MLRRLASMAIVLALGSVLTAAGPAEARANSYYVALGDSLAFGFQPVKPLDRTEGYVAQVRAALDHGLILDNLGCPGETTATLINGGICPYPGATSQLAAAEKFLRTHRGRVRLVTLDIGANDANACVHSGVIDDACVSDALATVAANLARIVLRLKAAAPYARFVAMTYYDPYLAAWLSGPAGQQFAAHTLRTTDDLNAVLSAVYQVGGVRVADVAGAFASHDMTLVNGVPVNVTRICQWTWMCPPPPGRPDIHANKQGYAAIARAFLARL
jgi:lysophospholipase L1-like esterase